MNRLRAARSTPIVVVVAPAGYGKTTVLSQWAERDPRPFAWVSVDERDNDAIVLLRHIGEALHRVEPLSPLALQAFESPRRSIWEAAVPRLGSAMTAAAQPFVLVLDDADVLPPGESAEAVAALTQHLPEGSTLVVAGRSVPQLSIGALRADRRLLELGPEDLALTSREARQVLRDAGVNLAEADATALLGKTEGWAAALNLAALSLGDGVDGEEVRGDDRYLVDYIRSECFSRLTPPQLTFLRRTSILAKMSASLCDHVLERKDSARLLDSLNTAHGFLVPLDRRQKWLRLRYLVRELLARELTECEPQLVPILSRRAAEWFEANGDTECALEAAAQARDPERFARLFTELGVGAFAERRVDLLEAWLNRLDIDGERQTSPQLLVVGAWIHALRGRGDAAESWLSLAEDGKFAGSLPDGSQSLRPWIALVRAALCREGVDRMLADAGAAVAELPAGSRWRPIGLLLQGVAYLLRGDDDRASAVLAESAAAASHTGAPETRLAALGQGAAGAAARKDTAATEMLLAEARVAMDEDGLSTNQASALARVAWTRSQLRRGRWDGVRDELRSVRRSSRSLTNSLPWLAVQVRLELAAAYVSLRDAGAAKMLLAEIDEVLRHTPRLGVLAKRRDELETAIRSLPDSNGGNPSSLTKAELRLLPLLTTHLSLPEIGARLHLSHSTIKTQAHSIYRKLGASGRSEAIELAAGGGLIEAPLRVALGS